MSIEFRCHSDAASQEEQHIQCINSQREDWTECKRFVDRRADEVNQREGREHGDKHDVVDYGRVSRVRIVNHISNEGDNEESPKKLRMVSDQRLTKTGRKPTCKPLRPRLIGFAIWSTPNDYARWLAERRKEGSRQNMERMRYEVWYVGFEVEV